MQIIAGWAFFIILAFQSSGAEIPVSASVYTKAIRSCLAGLDLDTSQMRTLKGNAEWIDKVKIPKGKPLVEVALHLWRALEKLQAPGLDVLEKKNEILFTFRDESRRRRKIVLFYSGVAYVFRVSLVLDEFEKAPAALLQKFTALSPSFGYIVPLDLLEEACLKLRGKGEIIARLPMETRQMVRSQEIICLQSGSTATSRALSVLKKPPCALSWATHPPQSILLADQRILRLIFGELRKHATGFLEIGLMRNSLAAELAGEARVPYLFCREILDVRNARKATGQMRKIMIIAEKNSLCMASAPLCEETYSLLEKTMPDFLEHGIRFCVPSQLNSDHLSHPVPMK